jgi:hypothetical protein
LKNTPKALANFSPAVGARVCSDEREQAPLPDLFYSSIVLFIHWLKVVNYPKLEQVRKGGLPPLLSGTQGCRLRSNRWAEISQRLRRNFKLNHY